MTRPMRVLHMMHDSRRSGVPAVVSALLTSFDRTVVEPAAFFAHDGVYAEDLRQAGITVITLGPRTPFLWRFKRFLGILLLPRLVREYDFIHAHSVKMTPMGLAAAMLGARVVFHLHEKAAPSPLVRAMLGAAGQVVFCAANCAAHYAGIPVKRAETIPNAIRIPEYTGKPRAERERRIVMLGSINANKGQDILIRAFASLQPLDARLVIHGTVGLSARGYVAGLHEFVRERGLQDRVLFPGPTSDAPAVLDRSYLLVHSSLNECLSISVLEAMAHGVPVIANAIAGMDEIITDGVNGFLVPPGDAAAMGAKIRLLMEDDRLWQALSDAGRRTIAERFDMAQRVGRFVALYRAMLDMPEARP